MDLLHRIRWANVARAAALLAAVALVVAWPHLRSAPPALPPEPVLATTPAQPPPSPVPDAEFGVERAEPEHRPTLRVRRRHRARPKHRSTPRRAPARPHRHAPRAPVPARARPPRAVRQPTPAQTPARPAPARAAPRWAPPAPRSEFGFD